MFKKLILKAFRIKEYLHENAKINICSYKVYVRSDEDYGNWHKIFEASEKWELDDWIDVSDCNELKVETIIVAEVIIKK